MLYFFLGRMGLRLEAIAGFATLIWPPTGIALAACLFFGCRLAPAIFLGAFLVNFSLGAPGLSSIAIAVGNTLEAVAAAHFLLGTRNFHESLDRTRDVFRLALAALLSPLISATIGVTSLWLSNIVQTVEWLPAWKAWYTGDALGDLIVAPFLLCWISSARTENFGWRQSGEALLMVTVAIFSGLIVFGPASQLTAGIPWRFAFWPLIIWAGLRFGPLGSSSLVLMLSILAIWGTARGHGPFVAQNLNDSLFILHSYLAIVSLTGMVLAAITAERRHRVEALRLLATSSDLLNTSSDPVSTLTSVVPLVATELSDVCSIDLLNEGTLKNVARAERQGRSGISEALGWTEAAASHPEGAVARVLRGGHAELYPVIAAAELGQIAGSSERAQAMTTFKLRSLILAPLSARGQMIGLLSLARVNCFHRFDGFDLSLARDLAKRAALAIDSARLQAETHEAIRARDEFLSIASHELRTPLTSMSLLLQMLSQSLTQPQPDLAKAIHRARSCEDQSRRLAKLLDELLDLTRIRLGRMPLALSPVDLAGIVREVIRDFAATSPSHISARTDETIGRWDSLRIQQIVTNLLSNAIKYGEGHPIEVRVKSDPAAQWAILTVTDHGMGIPRPMHRKIFERFERAVGSAQVSGLGLGLYITRQIVEAHGGHIDVQSEPGRGSTFTVFLPRHHTRSPSLHKAEAAA